MKESGFKTIFLLSVVIYSGGCSLQEPCTNGLYYDSESGNCLKQTEKSCGYQGKIDCYNPQNNPQDNVLSWTCDTQYEEPICIVDRCHPNSSPSEDKKRCECNNGYYFDINTKLCQKYDDRHCGADGTTNCYDETINDQTHVLSWICDSQSPNHPVCLVDNCYTNAVRNEDKLSCKCATGYYEDAESGNCLKLNGEHCGHNGELNCYTENPQKPGVSSWACEVQTSDNVCIIEDCIRNASKSADKQSCECNEGYYYDSEADACINMSGHHCGFDGNYDCYEHSNDMSIISWSCELTEGITPTCTIDNCILHAHEVQSGQSNSCECDFGYYYDADLNTCLRVNGSHCGLDGTIDCYHDSQPRIASWDCEVNETNHEAKCVVDNCIRNASRSADKQFCECDFGYYYDEAQDACIRYDGTHCGRDGTINCYDTPHNTVLEWDCYIDDSTSDAYCIADTCVRNANITTNKQSCQCVNNYYYDDKYKRCIITDQNHCGHYGTINCTTYDPDIDKDEITCQYYECYKSGGPVLCESSEVRDFIYKHRNEFVNSLDQIETNDVCKFYTKMNNIFNTEEIIQWCNNNSICESTDFISQCYIIYVELLFDIIQGKIPTPENYEGKPITIETVTLMVNVGLEKRVCH